MYTVYTQYSEGVHVNISMWSIKENYKYSDHKFDNTKVAKPLKDERMLYENEEMCHFWFTFCSFVQYDSDQFHLSGVSLYPKSVKGTII